MDVKLSSDDINHQCNFAGDGQVVLVTGGDDQALRLMLLDLDRCGTTAGQLQYDNCGTTSCKLGSEIVGGSGRSRVSLHATLLVNNAHFSAVKVRHDAVHVGNPLRTAKFLPWLS